jgi:hypothetical protein
MLRAIRASVSTATALGGAWLVAQEWAFAIIRTMTKTMKEAIEALRELPEERQEMVARAILNYTSHDGGEVYPLSDEEREAVRVGITQADRGEFVSDGDLQAFRNRHRA